MGFDLDRFTKAVDEDFKCSICLAVLENPLATPCGHVFCGNCVLPWVVQHGSCPLKCDKFSTKELNNVLPLRNLILKLEIRCDNHIRGCQEVVQIQMLSPHLEDCDFAPVTCTNKGCEVVVNIKDQVQHETKQCEYRAVGSCEQGCSLVLQHNAVADHSCLKALQAHTSNLQTKISNQDHSLKKTTMRFGKREKSLLAQIACLQNENHMQALRFQKKLNECKAELEYMSALAVYDRPCEELSLTLQLCRENNSLGLNIIGGNRVEGLSEGIIVSRIIEDGPADKSQLRLHDRVIKVNGVDLSKATHEEAVEAFKNADEPIIVQVLRRATRNKATGDKDCATLCNVGTQTDLQSEDLLWKVLQRCPSPLDTSNGGIVIDGLCEISPQEQMTVIDDDLMHDLDAMDNLDIPIIDEDGMDKAYEMEYEDITLTRGSDGTKLGLTLCCFREEDAGVIISEVDPNSIAGDDGRIRAGDQILQINGEDVLNNDQALSLFAQKSDTTSILVCRSQLQYDECLFDENSLLEDIQLDMLEQTHQESMQFTSCLLADHDSTQLDDDSKTDTTGTTETTSLHHEKDSGVGRATDESVRNDESSGQENIPDDCSSTHQKYPAQQPSLGSRDLRYSNDSFISNGVGDPEFPGHEISLEDCMKFQAALESKCDKHMRSDTDESMRGKESKVMRLGSDSMETTSLSGDSLSRTSRNRSGASDQDEGTNHRDASKSNVWVTQQNGQKGLIPNGKPQGSPEEPEYHGCEQESRKLEMIVENGQVGSPTHRPTDLGLDSLRDSDTHLPQISPHEQDTKTMTSSSSGSTRQHRAPRTVPGSPSRSKSSSGSRDRSKSSSSSGSSKEKTSPVKVATSRKDCPVRQTPPPHPSIPYQRRPATNPHMRSQQFVHRNPYFLQQEEAAAHLITQNWKLQQQNLQLKKSLESLGPNQKLHSCQSIMSIPSHAKHYRSYLHLVNQNEENSLGTSQPNKKIINRDEWKVKIRSDGTRYITKKNTRGKILKDRANKIQEERGGLTTDDEAVSEMKLGKYWSKEDRKRHLERARDQRLRREYMMQSRMECLQEQMEEDGKKEPNIVELSQRKMLRKKSARKMMLDDFTTVEEMLVHGTRVSPETAKTFCSNPLLNVTTV